MSFRGTRVVHHQCDPCVSEPIPMRKPPTGEPCAGEPHARFGGRGRREPFPTPYQSLFYPTGLTNWPSPGLPTIFPFSITVFPRKIVRIGTPLTLRP